MQEIRAKAQALVNEYNKNLLTFGIKIDLSKKYFETSVGERDTYYNDPGIRILDKVALYFDKKRERKYKNEKNRYHCLVLSVMPIENGFLHKDHCKNYAFSLRKVERIHIGEKPQHVSYEENEVLAKIEKRLKKILQKAKIKSAKNVCKDTPVDAIRYCFANRYAYKRKILGKSRFFWDMVIIIFGVLMALLFTLILTLI